MDVAIELQLLVWAAALGLVHLLWGSAAAQPQRGGMDWNVGPRDEPRPLTGVAARLQRAFANYRETFPIFAVAVLACAVAEKFSDLSALGALLYVGGRVLYLPLYAMGTPWLRSLVWIAATAGIVLVIIAFLA